MSINYFDAKCPNCGEPMKLWGEDADGPFREVSSECEECGAEVTQRVEWRYEYDLVDKPELVARRPS